MSSHAKSGVMVLLAVLAACATAADDGDAARGELGTNPTPGGGRDPDESKECRSPADCPSGWTCPLTGSGEFVRGVCTPPRSTPQGPTYSYGGWSEWSVCGTACSGTQSRTRTCSLDADGTDAACSSCGGACTETRDCPCSGDCKDTPWGTVPEGSTKTAYKFAHATTGKAFCEASTETRTCVGGKMTGSFPSATCTNYACSVDGASFQVGVWYLESNAKDAPWHPCGMDGNWGAGVGTNPNPNAGLCPWGSAWLPTYSCGRSAGKTYLCDPGGTWRELTAPSGCPNTP